MTPCIDVYKSKTQSDRSLDKLKLRILVRGDLHSKEIIGYNWDPTASTSNLNFFLAYASNNKKRLQQLYSIGEFLQSNVKHRVLRS